MVNSAKLRSSDDVAIRWPVPVCRRRRFAAARPRRIGVLAQDIEQLDKVADDLTGRQVRVGSHAAKLNLEEVHQVVLGKRSVQPK